jgi:phytoene dehydrogenase-like protein
MQNNEYDVIIIGAGIGGLVCGCYLAKAGLKTLIVEKNAHPGGYCTSFKRGGFVFDSCVHSLVSCRKKGIVGKLIDDFNIKDELNLYRSNPSDIIITPDHKINIFNNVEDTIDELGKYFISEKDAIKKFFSFVLNTPIASFQGIRKNTFKEILDKYLSNEELKHILSIITYGCTALPSSRLSAIVGCLVYKEFIFDGGYYTEGGIGKFTEILTKKYREYNGELRLSIKAKKIRISYNTATSIILENKEELFSKNIVSACDLKETFSELIDGGFTEKESINDMEPSLSSFLAYIGTDSDLSAYPELKSQIWLTKETNIEKVYTQTLNMKINFLNMNSPSAKSNNYNKNSIALSLPSPFVNEDYWTNSVREDTAQKLITIAEKIIPDLGKKVKLKITASPSTLRKITLNYKGSSYGWAGTPDQFLNEAISQKTKINNLYLSGHWANLSCGLTSVVAIGFSTSKMILLKHKNIGFKK